MPGVCGLSLRSCVCLPRGLADNEPRDVWPECSGCGECLSAPLEVASGPATREDATRAQVAGSQIRIVPSAPAVASQVLSWAIATACPPPVWPVRVWRSAPVTGSQIRAVPSWPVVASRTELPGNFGRTAGEDLQKMLVLLLVDLAAGEPLCRDLLWRKLSW